MTNEQLTRRVKALKIWIAKNEALADQLASTAGELRQSGQSQLADAVLVCSRNFRILALDLRGQLAATRPFEQSSR